MKKILITGSEGKIGRALGEGLSDEYRIVPFDKERSGNAADYDQLYERAVGASALIHLAFDLKRENSTTGRKGNPANLVMGRAALAVATDLELEHCIMASSVNAARTANPNNLSYRTTKLILEAEAEQCAQANPETRYVSVRFGRVTADDRPPALPLRDDQTWISHRDVTSLTKAILHSSAPLGHQVVYGLSNRPDMPYTIDNPYGWRPEDWFGVEAQK